MVSPARAARRTYTVAARLSATAPGNTRAAGVPGDSDTSDDQHCHSIELPAEERRRVKVSTVARANELPPSGSRWRSSPKPTPLPALTAGGRRFPSAAAARGNVVKVRHHLRQIAAFGDYSGKLTRRAGQVTRQGRCQRAAGSSSLIAKERRLLPLASNVRRRLEAGDFFEVEVWFCGKLLSAFSGPHDCGAGKPKGGFPPLPPARLTVLLSPQKPNTSKTTANPVRPKTARRGACHTNHLNRTDHV